MIEQSKWNIAHTVRINKSKAEKDNTPLLSSMPVPSVEDFFRQLERPYPKFFKMDLLCKWAWLGAEILLAEKEGFIYEGIDKTRIVVVLSTSHGCIEVDKGYQQTLATIPSPALFVYTLPNIMLGEICIHHGIKGEQLCMVSDAFDSEELFFSVNDLLTNKGMDACLCGWVDATAEATDLCLFWVTRSGSGKPFTQEQLEQLYQS
jgi:hypothetical protein